jgi:hypothetical protein
MTSIERTAYPRFRRVVTPPELAELSPTPTRWPGRGTAPAPDARLLALVVSLKCSQRLGYFPRVDQVPAAAVDHLRRCLDLAEGTTPNLVRSVPGRRSASRCVSGSVSRSIPSGPGRWWLIEQSVARLVVTARKRQRAPGRTPAGRPRRRR